ncbi:uncharacterized protein [Nicotiana sylvestris]|uniref:uncharacterized protein n=1 Tax=Nicotiana sylvestris TaxID=4096 RepID=UPI00388C907D
MIAEDSKLWDIICDGPYVPTKELEELPFSMAKINNEYTKADKKAVEKNFRAKKILVCGIGLEEYNRIFTCDTTKEIWEDLQIAHEGTTQLHSLGETIPRNKLVKKILRILPSSWESKVNVITESKDLQELTIEELIRNLKTYELKRNIDSERREPKKEKNLVLKADNNDSSDEDSDMAYLTKRFQKMVRRNGEMLKTDSSNIPKNYYLCYKCGNPGHFMKDYPLLNQEFSKNYHRKIAKMNPVPFKDFKRKRSAHNMMRQALAAWGDSSSESENKPNTCDGSMMAVEGEEIEYDLTFALMAQSNDDEDDGNKEVNFRDVQINLKSYSPKKLMSLTNVLINAFHSLVEDRDSLTLELGESKQTRDNLVVVVTDHKRTIEIFRKEKDDLLAEITDIRETIVKSWTKSKPENYGKGKEIASEKHIRLENKVKAIRTRMCDEIEKNEQIQTNLEKVKNDLEKSLKWTWSLEATTTMHTNDCENRQGIGFQREKTPHNPHSKYVTVSGNKVEFLSKICIVIDLVTGEVVLVAKRYTNIYVADFKSLQSGDLSCLKAVDDDAELWHRRLGHTSFSLLNKLIQKDLVHGLPMSKFKMQKVFDVCARGKHMKSSFKCKSDVSTSKPLELLHMDLCGHVRVQSRRGKRYIFMIVDDYSKFTWTLFLKNKDETVEVFVAFVKKIQVKMESRVACIRSDHGIEFDNVKFDKFCNDNGITHHFSAPRTPQQNGVVERKNKTLEEMARTMLIDSGIAKNFWAEVVNSACYLSAEEDQDGETLLVPGEVINMKNIKEDMMSQVKEISEDNTTSSSI